MSDKPPFDPVKACFYLIAAVIGVECIIVLASVGACVWYADIIIGDPQIVCDPKDRLSSLLTGALAAALAFAGGYMRKDK